MENQLKQELLLTSDEVVFKTRLGGVIEAFREELDDHREGINENTTEIEANHEFLQELSGRIDKLAERLDELTLLAKGKNAQEKAKVEPLTKREKDVFQAIYAIGADVPFTTYRDIARNLCITESLAAQFVTNIIEKGVLIVKRYSEGRAYINLEPKFREQQAKKNVVGVNALLTYWAH